MFEVGGWILFLIMVSETSLKLILSLKKGVAGFEVGSMLSFFWFGARGGWILMEQLYTDFILADLLISCTPFVKEVVFQYVVLLTPVLPLASNPPSSPLYISRISAHSM